MPDDIDTSWQLRRPDLVLQQIADQFPFNRPRTLFARVDGPYARQRLAGVTVLWQEPAVDELERTTLTEQALARLGVTRTGAPYLERPLAVPVVVRPGSAWSSWDELEAFYGLRYGSNWVDVRQGDVLTVTTRGWTSWLDGLWGDHPRAQWSACRAA